MATVFLRLLAHDDKPAALAQAVERLRDGQDSPDVHVIDPESFRQVPGSPFAYWVSEKVRRLFKELTALESDQRVARRTNGTTEDNRWIRAEWEVPLNRKGRQQGWVVHAKGGEFSPFYSSLHLRIAWDDQSQSYPGYEGTIHRPDVRPASLQFFFRRGITWSRRSQKGLSFRVLPAQSIFGDKGPSIFDESKALLPLLGLLNSRAYRALVSLQMAFGSYEAGVIQRTPVPDLSVPEGRQLGQLALICVKLKRDLDRSNETSHVFHLPALLQVPGETLADRIAVWQKRVADADRQLAEHQQEIDDIAFRLYGIDGEDRRLMEAEADTAGSDDLDDSESEDE